MLSLKIVSKDTISPLSFLSVVLQRQGRRRAAWKKLICLGLQKLCWGVTGGHCSHFRHLRVKSCHVPEEDCLRKSLLVFLSQGCVV